MERVNISINKYEKNIFFGGTPPSHPEPATPLGGGGGIRGGTAASEERRDEAKRLRGGRSNPPIYQAHTDVYSSGQPIGHQHQGGSSREL